MPTYEYACSACGEHLELVQSFRDDPLTVCPNCGGSLRKVFGSIGVVFKGSGFYKTDSRPSSKSGKSEKSGETKTSETAAKSAETTSSSSGDSKSSGSSSDKGSSKSSSKSSTSEAAAS